MKLLFGLLRSKLPAKNGLHSAEAVGYFFIITAHFRRTDQLHEPCKVQDKVNSMGIKEIFWAAVALVLVWLGHLFAPHIISLTEALGALVAMAAYPIGLRFNRKLASAQPIMVSSCGQSVFPVRRRGMLWLGWFFIALGVASYAVNWARQFADVGVLLASPALLFVGVFSIVMARNVREIRVDGDRIQFLPVGASLPLDEIIAIKKPAQSGALTHIELSTKAARSRYVPGALLQWNRGCRLTITGSNGAAVLAALSQRLPVA